jgi:hypothetical protein
MDEAERGTGTEQSFSRLTRWQDCHEYPPWEARRWN